jgi:membrane associated rhomboid family serine protease
VDPDSGGVERFGTAPFYASLGRAFVAMCALIPVLFLIELVDRATGHRLDQWGGIRPHEVAGLDGIVLAPLLHASFIHLYSNSVPLIITGTFVLARGLKHFLLVTALIAVVSGLAVWLLGRPGIPVIGASGVIFGYLGYLFVRGLVERSLWGIAVGLLVGLLYGTQISGVLPTDQRISWQAHLFGLAGGVVAAIVFRRRRRRATPSGGDQSDIAAGLTLPLGSDE